MGLHSDAQISQVAEECAVLIHFLQPHLIIVAEMATEALAAHFRSASSFGPRHRVALYAHLGDDAAARDAAQQARARWKKPPKWIAKELTRLGG